MQVFSIVRGLLVVGFAFVLVCSGSFMEDAQAGTISASFQGGAGGNGLVAANSAGVVPAFGWNDISGTTQTNYDLLDESGASSGATLTFTGLNGGGNGTSFSNLGDTRLMAGNLYSQGFSPLTLNIGGTIPYSNFDLYVYFNGNVSAGQTMNVTVVEAAQTILANDGGLANETAFIESIAGSQGNYVHFSNLKNSTLPNFTLTFQGVGGQYGYLNGFQLVEVEVPPVPEPTTLTLFACGVLLMIKRSRRGSRA